MPDLTQLRQLAEAGTPGPWETDGRRLNASGTGNALAWIDHGVADDITETIGAANARKIVAAVNLLPATIELVDAVLRGREPHEFDGVIAVSCNAMVAFIDHPISCRLPDTDPIHSDALRRFYAAAGGDG